MSGDRLAEIKHRRKSGIPLWPHEMEWMIDEIERLRNALRESVIADQRSLFDLDCEGGCGL